MLRLPRALWGAVALALTAGGHCAAAVAAAPPAESKKRADPVRSTILKVARNGGIDEQERAATCARGAGPRRVQPPVGPAQRGARLRDRRRAPAREGQQLGARLKVVFLILDCNREWWSKSGPPGSGARLLFGGSRVIFQYFPCKDSSSTRSPTSGRRTGTGTGAEQRPAFTPRRPRIAVGRASGFVTWEYYFDFGGSPPWISGMAQGTALQALARGAQRLERAVLPRGRKARPGRVPARDPDGRALVPGQDDGTRCTASRPRMNVLNRMLQAVNGICTPTRRSLSARVPAAASAGDCTARRNTRAFNGASENCSTAGLAASRAPEANPNYHTLNRDFARNFLPGDQRRVLLQGPDNFTSVPEGGPQGSSRAGAFPSLARASKGVRFRFKLSKISRVNITVLGPSRDAPTSGPAPRIRGGDRYFRWVPPKARGSAPTPSSCSRAILAGNTNTTTGRRARAPLQAVQVALRRVESRR